jgi:hypothetical protein
LWVEAELRRCIAAFDPKDPPRSGQLSFRLPENSEPLVELPLAEAVPSLCWTEERPAHPTVAFWRAATLTALRLVADRCIEPDESRGRGWRLGPLGDDAEALLRDLEATAPAGLGQVRPYLDAVADYLASPDMDAGVRISLLLELPDGVAALDDDAPNERFRITVQVHSLTEPSNTADAADLWEHPEQFGPGARAGAMIAASTESEIRQTWNVHADSKTGAQARMVQAGAHLDSVVPGPGINDNGSGSAALLEVAEQMANVRTANRVRYSWWGAEELGLLGSEHYIDDLAENHPSKLRKIQLYLNFDMVGSPNYALFVYDGDNSAFPVGPGAAEGPEGSAQIEKAFHDYFESQGLPSAETPFSGRSDYGPFIAQGIPAGGLFTGAEGVKTASQAALFGGTAGEAYDPCYHQACDTIDNVSEAAIDANSDAIAHVLHTYAMDLSSLREPVQGQVHGDGTPGGGGLHDDHDHEAADR